MDFDQVIESRYSARKFSDQKVSEKDIQAILKAAILAPTAVNKQPFHIWVLTSSQDLEKAAQTTRFTFHAPLIFVLGAKMSEAWVRKYDSKNFSEVDSAIVGTHMMLEIENRGLGTTWVAAFDAPKMQELFPEMKDYSLIAMFPTGYKSRDAQPGPMHDKRKDIEKLVTFK